MTICQRCERAMSITNGCDPVPFPDGTPPILYGDEPGLEGVNLPARCHDCGVRIGFSHHKFCDMESCPRCQGQLLGCGCWVDLVEDELDDA